MPQHRVATLSEPLPRLLRDLAFTMMPLPLSESSSRSRMSLVSIAGSISRKASVRHSITRLRIGIGPDKHSRCFSTQPFDLVDHVRHYLDPTTPCLPPPFTTHCSGSDVSHPPISYHPGRIRNSSSSVRLCTAVPPSSLKSCGSDQWQSAGCLCVFYPRDVITAWRATKDHR